MLIVILVSHSHLKGFWEAAEKHLIVQARLAAAAPYWPNFTADTVPRFAFGKADKYSPRVAFGYPNTPGEGGSCDASRHFAASREADTMRRRKSLADGPFVMPRSTR
jgi:hypothetical protein